jgi:hypothetical protein
MTMDINLYNVKLICLALSTAEPFHKVMKSGIKLKIDFDLNVI